MAAAFVMLLGMNRAQQYAQNFRMHRAALQELYAQLPEEQAHFQPWPEGMSFIRLADHLSGSSERLMALTRGETPPAPGSAAPGAQPAGSDSLQQARERLSASTEAALQAISALDDAALDTSVTAFGGRQMPVSTMLDFAVSHEAHHKGQAWLMARMVGLKPPFFVTLG